MKTKTVALRLELPASDAELLIGLNDLRDDPALVVADRALATATADLAKARADVLRYEAEAPRLREDVSRGRATVGQLDFAIVAARRAAGLVPAFESQLKAAEAEHARATLSARDRALAIVETRFDVLLKADRAAIALLNDLDRMYCSMTFRLHAIAIDPATGGSGRHDIRGRTGEFPDRALARMRYANDTTSR